jgi:hypothetical protein
VEGVSLVQFHDARLICVQDQVDFTRPQQLFTEHLDWVGQVVLRQELKQGFKTYCEWTLRTALFVFEFEAGHANQQLPKFKAIDLILALVVELVASLLGVVARCNKLSVDDADAHFFID